MSLVYRTYPAVPRIARDAKMDLCRGARSQQGQVLGDQSNEVKMILTLSLRMASCEPVLDALAREEEAKEQGVI